MSEIKHIKDWTADDLQQAIDDNRDDLNDLHDSDQAKDQDSNQ